MFAPLVGGGGGWRFRRGERASGRAPRKTRGCASAGESLTLGSPLSLSRRAEALPLLSPIAFLFPCFLFLRAHLLAILFLIASFSLHNHRLAEALEDDGGAGGQGGGQANDGYDDGGKGGVSF